MGAILSRVGPLLIAAFFLFGALEPARPESKSPSAPAVTQKLIDEVVDAISTAVVEKLKKDGSIPMKPTQPAPSAGGPDQDMMAGGVMSFATQAGVVLRSYPELWRNLTRIPVLLDKSESGGRGLGAFFAMLCIAVAAALGTEALLRRALDGLRRRLAGYITDTTEFWPIFGLACLDALGLAAVWLVSYGLLGLWFRGSDEQARLAAAVVSGFFSGGFICLCSGFSSGQDFRLPDSRRSTTPMDGRSTGGCHSSLRRSSPFGSFFAFWPPSRHLPRRSRRGSC